MKVSVHYMYGYAPRWSGSPSMRDDWSINL